MKIKIPTMTGQKIITLAPGRPIILLGPNGTGKTRLGIYIDDNETSGFSHRIAAQRSLELPDDIYMMQNYDKSLKSFLRDKADKNRKQQQAHRLSQNYYELLEVLFAEHYGTLERAHVASRGKKTIPRSNTLLDQLQKMWADLVPHQELIFTRMTVRAEAIGGKSASYEASQMSDGERYIFYILGQALLVPSSGVLIVDEPELHINKAILGRLWDLIEKERSDCAFVYITHDLDFIASRQNAQKFAIHGYQPSVQEEVLVRTRTRMREISPPCWEIEALPEDSSIPNEILTRIAGSRQPILFVEGNHASLDSMVYRQVYSKFTVIPVESCARVVQIFKSFQSQPQLHRLRCAGLIDLDGRNSNEPNARESGIYILPVSELENVFLLRNVFLSLARTQSFNEYEAQEKFLNLQTKVFENAKEDIVHVSLRFTQRKIYEASEKFGLKARSIEDLSTQFNEVILNIQPRKIYNDFQCKFAKAINEQDYDKIVQLYDNKGLMRHIASVLGVKDRSALYALISRTLMSSEGLVLLYALRETLPTVEVER